MNYTHLLPGDRFSFTNDPETIYVKMTRTTYRHPMTHDKLATPLVLKGDPEVIVTHVDFMTFMQLRYGETFHFTERKTLLCRKQGHDYYEMLDGPEGTAGQTFFVFGDPCVKRIKS